MTIDPNTGATVGPNARHPTAEPDLLLRWVVIGVAATVAAIVAFGQARVDWRYQLAGLADPFLGRPAPGWTAGLYAIGSALLLFVEWVLNRSKRPVEGPAPHRGRPLPRGWWIVVTLWLAYAAGALVTVAAGGPERHPGTLRLELGPPLGLAVDAPATCTTAPGSPTTVTSVVPDHGGVPSLQLANEATGEPNRWPTPGAVIAVGVYERWGDPLVIPGLPVRQQILNLWRGQGASTAGRGQRFVTELPVSFLGAYWYETVSSAIDGPRGSAVFRAARQYALSHANELIAADPWPSSYRLAATWSCDLAAPTLGPAPTVAPGGGVGPVAWPSPTFIPSPGGNASSDGAWVELDLASASDWFSVRLAGAEIADAQLVRLNGPGTARADGMRFEVAQPDVAVRGGGVTEAVFRFRLVGASDGTEISLVIEGGSTGLRAFTFSNLAGGHPVPVLTELRHGGEGYPVTFDAGWLIEPVGVRRVP